MKTASNIQTANNPATYDVLGGFVTSSLVAVVSLFRGKSSVAKQYTCREEGAARRNLSLAMAFLDW